MEETNIIPLLSDPYYYQGSVFDWGYEYNSSTLETDLSVDDYDYDYFVNAILLLDEPAEPDSFQPEPYHHLQVQVQEGHHANKNNNNYDDDDPCNYSAANETQWPNSAVTDMKDYSVNTTTTVLMEKQPHLDCAEGSQHQQIISWSEEALLAMASSAPPPLGLKGKEPPATNYLLGTQESSGTIISQVEGGTVTTTETTTLLPSNNNNNMAYMNMMQQGVESRSSSWREDEDRILKAAIMQKLAKRKKPTMWTPEEHRSFLCGIKMFGWGKWKEIADLIPSRTVSQITSHAQKYQKHTMNSNSNKRRRTTRSSIYDITL